MAPTLRFEMAYGDLREVNLDGYLKQSKAMFGGDPSLHVEIVRWTWTWRRVLRSHMPIMRKQVASWAW